ncbi:alpha/beta fold hydrolase [bacterium]|nr:alpha/beta fold hydrolase [candidate division CSSED10-310 bacterium]
MVTPDSTLYPFTSHMIAVRPGIRMHTIDEGGGDPIILVHGNPTWSFFYRNLVRALRNDFRVIAPDHVGCGLSDKPGPEHYHYTLSNRIDDLVSLMDTLLPDTPYRMVVHDWGGMIGLGAALRQPDRLRQLVVLNTAGFLLPATRRFPTILRFTRSPIGRFLTLHWNTFVRGTLRWGTVRPLPPDIRKHYRLPYDSPTHRIAIQQFVEDIPLGVHDAAYDAVKTIDDNLFRLAGIPLCIVWGKQDFIFDDAFLDEWVRRFPEAPCHVLESAGHLLLEDEPGTACGIIRDFFLHLRTA